MMMNRASTKIIERIVRSLPIRKSSRAVFQVSQTYLTRSSCVYTNRPACLKSSALAHHSWLVSSARKYATRARQPTHGRRKGSHTSTVMYVAAMGITMAGTAYAAVPLYRMFCAATGLGGQTKASHDNSGKIADLEVVDDRELTVKFNADVASSMQWNFQPQQHEIKVLPGETALAFYTARNPTDKPIIGISTYNVIPFDAAQYFNKIQCFCFEEQILNPHEQVDMPVFFYIDPEYTQDPKLEKINEIVLSYTFFEAKDGMSLPLPGFPVKPHGQ
ncbi:cytochrome c oxidase assembly protein ctaG-like [Watersipora subatra]|uniref:cytochrome c oxidase assembly protein ctaG-like n=1 Tax=Watersipora subatra TaxID=2589382 RepID=UPI00355B147F